MSWLTDLVTPVAGSFIKDVGDTVKQFVTTDKDRLELELKMKELEANFNIALAQEISKNTESINATMRAEAGAEHWPTYSWRPFIGFVFGGYIASMYILPLFGIAPVTMSADLVMAAGAILGVASFFRGQAQANPNIPTVNKG